MTIINLTPHTIKIVKGDKIAEIPPSGKVARVSIKTQKTSAILLTKAQKKSMDISGFDFVRQEYSDIVDLPQSNGCDIFIVSAIVKQACFDRHDLVYPCDFIRDEKGNIIACKSLSF